MCTLGYSISYSRDSYARSPTVHSQGRTHQLRHLKSWISTITIVSTSKVVRCPRKRERNVSVECAWWFGRPGILKVFSPFSRFRNGSSNTSYNSKIVAKLHVHTAGFILRPFPSLGLPPSLLAPSTTVSHANARN